MRKFNVTVNGVTYSVDVEEITNGSVVTPVVTNVVQAPVAAPPKAAVGEGTPVKAPMPGLILGLSESDGATVKANQKILVLEAMKMENDINAPTGGTITYVVKKGDSVETGAVLAYIK